VNIRNFEWNQIVSYYSIRKRHNCFWFVMSSMTSTRGSKYKLYKTHSIGVREPSLVVNV